MSCSIDDCQRSIKAKSLCEMHYRRLLRTGHPQGKGRPGPQPHPTRTTMRRMFSEMSERTFDTYFAAMGILWAFADQADIEAAVRAATRPNGSLNVTKLRRAADAAIMRTVVMERRRNR